MKYERLLILAGDWPVIDSASLLAFGEDAKNLSAQLCRWVKAGKLLQVRRGFYVFPDAVRRTSARGVASERLANLLVRPSYVSLERALSIHGIIPESVPVVQSVTTSKPVLLKTPSGELRYHHIQAPLFFGYREMEIGRDTALVATPEKALLDKIYFSHGEYTLERIEELRLQNLDRLDALALDENSRRFGPRVGRFVSSFLKYAQDERQSMVDL